MSVHGENRPRVPKASDLLADDLRRRVIGEGLEPGTPLPSETDLVAEWGFSRATVREALRLLEVDGLIRIKRGPGGGITVGRPEPSHVTRSLALLLSVDEAPLRDLFDFRKLVEPPAAAMAAASASDVQRQALAAIADGTAEVGERQDGDRVDLHLLLAEASHNALLRVVQVVVGEVVGRYTDDEPLPDPDLEVLDRAHRRIARSVADGKGEAAARAMLRHLERFEQRVGEAGRLDEPVIPRARWRDGPLPAGGPAAANR